MKLKIASAEYEKKLADWFEKYPDSSETCTDQKIVDVIDRAAAMYEEFGREDAAAGKLVAGQKIFQTVYFEKDEGGATNDHSQCDSMQYLRR